MGRFANLCLTIILFFTANLSAQVQVTVTVNSGMSTTTCTDILSAPDPMWRVNINNEGWVTYPDQGACFTAVPNLQYTASYSCPSDVPPMLELCFRAFENDGLFPFLCDIDESCSETICQNFPIPPSGNSSNFTLALPNGLSSGGSVNFTIATSLPLIPDNDLPCNAYDFGTLNFGDHLGDAAAGGFQNVCATNLNEPDPNDAGFFINDAAVWFQFTTGPDPGGEVYVRVLSDPLNTGDDFDAEVMVYTAVGDTCTGAFTMELNLVENSTLNNIFRIYCPQPNTTYFVLVDGGYTTPTSELGAFGIEVVDIGVREGGDLKCDYEDLGVVPTGGTVGTDSLRSNFCATATGDPFIGSFVSQHSVWFGFIAPPSGHVRIEALTDRSVDSIGLQLALYRSFNNTCTGFFSNIASSYTFQDLDEVMEVSCLYPGIPYWILVDGDGAQPQGSFSISVTDAGDITPITNVDTVLCFGETLTVGTSVYSLTGNYADTLQLFAGCDSIVNSHVTVLEPLTLTINQTMPAIGMGNPSGIATASAGGGAGGYQYQWCDGETGDQAIGLVGGAQCCVTVTDANGCTFSDCFEVDFVRHVMPVYQNDTLLCYGDTNGSLSFHIQEGLPPYNYSWQNSTGSLSGTGIVNAEGEVVTIPDLPADTYTFTVADAYTDSTFSATVVSPPTLVTSLNQSQDASCFGFCDGALTIDITGGTGDYIINWSNGANTATINQLCANDYVAIVTDDNGCKDTLTTQVGQPAEFIATAELQQGVSCFEGSDGQVTVTTNGTPTAYIWSNGALTPTVTGLDAGFYDVTVTNADGCQDFASVEVTQPNEALSVQISIENPISCAGFSDGTLIAIPDGPFSTLSYHWNNGVGDVRAMNLSTGSYTLTITNEKGCTAENSFFLNEPTLITAQFRAIDVTCTSPPNGGIIAVDSVEGGTPGYLFSIDGSPFSNYGVFTGLYEGNYQVVVQDASGCEKSYNLVIAGPPVLEVTLGDDFEMQLGDTVSLTAQTNSLDLVYKWSAPLDSVTISQAFVSPLVSTAYTVEVFDTTTLCRASDVVFVTVVKNRPIFIPNAFSPNDDGANDEFMVFAGIGVRQIKSMRIFSRGGNLVYEQKDFAPNDPNLGWDGELNGKPLNPGVFVYVIEVEFVDNQVEVFKGDVTLLR